MREILFRGKRVDNGEWVEGFLVVVGKWYYILTGKLDITKGVAAFEGFVVISETVGQFTGLTDKNGKKIFEGDILCYWSERKEKYVGYCVVEYGMFNCSCCSGVYGWYLRNGDIRCCETEYTTGMYEVCGNIHDNPELLEVSGND